MADPHPRGSATGICAHVLHFRKLWEGRPGPNNKALRPEAAPTDSLSTIRPTPHRIANRLRVAVTSSVLRHSHCAVANCQRYLPTAER